MIRKGIVAAFALSALATLGASILSTWYPVNVVISEGPTSLLRISLERAKIQIACVIPTQAVVAQQRGTSIKLTLDFDCGPVGSIALAGPVTTRDIPILLQLLAPVIDQSPRRIAGLTLWSAKLPSVMSLDWSDPRTLVVSPNARQRGTTVRLIAVVLPWWIAFAILGSYPTVVFARALMRRRRDRRRGLCRHCGYNLTGLPEPRCPECGTEFDPALLNRPEAYKPVDGSSDKVSP